ncbi:MAG: hypothetical protein DRP57_02475 [Spirochaetes bacterium]|nr:MAG: hypothetical protein DRP57_02475 [Spirochaetota bacterium]
MTKWDNAKHFIDGTVKIFRKVDVLFNNIGAGIKSAPFDELNIEEIDRGIAVNLIATLYGCRAVLPYMKKRKNGHIINTTSIPGIRARSGLAVYTAAKHGVDGFSRALLNEVNDFGIRVSVLAPAAVKTAWAEKAGINIFYVACKCRTLNFSGSALKAIILFPSFWAFKRAVLASL